MNKDHDDVIVAFAYLIAAALLIYYAIRIFTVCHLQQ